ncbi:RICIN domain-containing protein [Streptomyces sp. NPDC020489]|uniref:RICIN domain-containing protein n=1 Tax=Streptomyces sp. NPDC020489 TaxID=3365077 RepID=UPI0037B13DB1
MSPAATRAADVTVPIGRDVDIVHGQLGARMVPWWGSAANDTVVRVWSAPYSGDTWNFQLHGMYTDADGVWPVVNIVNVKSERCLQPKDKEAKQNARVVIFDCNSASTAQQWIVRGSSAIPDGVQFVPYKQPELGITLQDKNSATTDLTLDYRNPANPAFAWRIPLA